MQSLGNPGNLQSGEARDSLETAVFTHFSTPVHVPSSAVWEDATLIDIMYILHSTHVRICIPSL